uniref:non-specific serine/threonine protein kinase n=1 Tax=Macrostomum lignano TaxID=282301 RepID=A0A1I8FID7_9PLAT
LHKGIGQLESLASLDLSHNPNLTSLPDEIGNLSKLWEMPLDGLKLSLDASAYPRSNQRTSHYRMKLMLVGFGGRGKTSLLRALMKLKTAERQSPPTVGIAVTPWSFRCYHRKQKWVTYQLSCCGLCRPRRCFLSQRAIYLLIYSLQSCFTVEGCDAELRRLKPWLVNIKAQAPACPVICVGTHADTLPSSGPNRDTIIANIRTRIETMIRRPGFPEIVEYVEVNAIRDNASVERLRTVIQSALEAFKVKGHHDLPVLQWYQLRKMATDAGLNMNDEKLSQAVRFLHESGVLLHFDDSTYRLNNLYFIDPQWLCRMMAQIVTVKEINGFIRSGVMRQSDLGLLFTGKRITEEDRHFIFPVSQIPQYLRILEKFEIVLPQKNDELLIPCRLPDIAAAGSSSPCAPSILKMGKRVMFACWQPPATGTAAAAATAASYDEAFFLLQTFEEATPRGRRGTSAAAEVPLRLGGGLLEGLQQKEGLVVRGSCGGAAAAVPVAGGCQQANMTRLPSFRMLGAQGDEAAVDDDEEEVPRSSWSQLSDIPRRAMSGSRQGMSSSSFFCGNTISNFSNMRRYWGIWLTGNMKCRSSSVIRLPVNSRPRSDCRITPDLMNPNLTAWLSFSSFMFNPASVAILRSWYHCSTGRSWGAPGRRIIVSILVRIFAMIVSRFGPLDGRCVGVGADADDRTGRGLGFDVHQPGLQSAELGVAAFTVKQDCDFT